jgi:uncharacterized cupredoxin-like copper-binding protein
MIKRAFLLLVLQISLAACSSTSGPSTNINLNMTDFAFSPNEFTVPAGAEISLKVTHDGAVAHEFIIMNYGTDAGHMFDEDDAPNVYWKIKVEPGITEAISFTAPQEPGVYQIVCGMPGHLQAGMVGTLTVVK